jgi:lysophospholipase L1-like esterase
MRSLLASTVLIVSFVACTVDGGPSRTRIMPLGDSITAQSSSYRAPLYGRMAPIDFDFVGGEWNGDDPTPDPDHEGHPGATLADLDAHVAGYLRKHSPDVILLYAGVNDVLLERSGTVAANRLDRLLTTIFEVEPGARVVVARIAPVRAGGVYDDRGQIGVYDTLIPGVATPWQARGKDVDVVDCYTGYEPSWFSDDIHPDVAGFAFIAAQFRGALGPKAGTIELP